MFSVAKVSSHTDTFLWGFRLSLSPALLVCSQVRFSISVLLQGLEIELQFAWMELSPPLVSADVLCEEPEFHPDLNEFISTSYLSCTEWQGFHPNYLQNLLGTHVYAFKLCLSNWIDLDFDAKLYQVQAHPLSDWCVGLVDNIDNPLLSDSCWSHRVCSSSFFQTLTLQCAHIQGVGSYALPSYG